jgi:hypothetical protein
MVVVPPTAGSQPSTATSELQALDGLRDIETREERLLAVAATPSPALIIAMLAVPPISFAGAWVALAIRRTRTSDPARRRRQGALRAARKRIADAQALPAPEAARAIEHALAGYLADRMDEPVGRYLGDAGSAFLAARGVAPPLVDGWRTLLGRCNELSFAAGAAGAADTLREQALACLAELERQKL